MSSAIKPQSFKANSRTRIINERVEREKKEYRVNRTDIASFGMEDSGRYALNRFTDPVLSSFNVHDRSNCLDQKRKVHVSCDSLLTLLLLTISVSFRFEITTYTCPRAPDAHSCIIASLQQNGVSKMGNAPRQHARSLMLSHPCGVRGKLKGGK